MGIYGEFWTVKKTCEQTYKIWLSDNNLSELDHCLVFTYDHKGKCHKVAVLYCGISRVEIDPNPIHIFDVNLFVDESIVDFSMISGL